MSGMSVRIGMSFRNNSCKSCESIEINIALILKYQVEEHTSTTTFYTPSLLHSAAIKKTMDKAGVK